MNSFFKNFPWQILLKLACLLALIIGANLLANWISDLMQFELRPANETSIHRLIMIFAAAYVMLIATPFVPGVEVGLGLMAMLGPKIVFLVYIATIMGLSLGYALGRLVPLRSLIRFLEQIRFARAAALLKTIKPMSTKDRLAFLIAKAPNRFVPFLLKYRYVALAIAINLPGNFLIGGGGGIALLAGTSGLFSFPGFVLTVAIAVLPFPIAFILLGSELFGI